MYTGMSRSRTPVGTSRPRTPISEVLRQAKSGIVDPSSLGVSSLSSFQTQTPIRSLVQNIPLAPTAQHQGLTGSTIRAATPPRRITVPAPPVPAPVPIREQAKVLGAHPPVREIKNETSGKPLVVQPNPRLVQKSREVFGKSQQQQRSATPLDGQGEQSMQVLRTTKPIPSKESTSRPMRHFDYQKAKQMGYMLDDDDNDEAEDEQKRQEHLVEGLSDGYVSTKYGRAFYGNTSLQQVQMQMCDKGEDKNDPESIMREIEKHMTQVYGEAESDSELENVSTTHNYDNDVIDSTTATEIRESWIPNSFDFMQSRLKSRRKTREEHIALSSDKKNGMESEKVSEKNTHTSVLRLKDFMDQLSENHTSKTSSNVICVERGEFQDRNIQGLHFPSLSRLTNLASLDLSDNKLGRSDPPEIIDIDVNEICTMAAPSSYLNSLFSSWRSLTHLSLAGNELSDTSIFSNCPQLVTLNLSSNRITQLKGLGNLRSLTELWLTANHIESLEDVGLQPTAMNSVRRVGLPDSLKLLVISRNKLKSLETLSALTKLRILDISENLLGSAADDNGDNADGVKIDKATSEEKRVWTCLKGLSNLEDLNISHNHLCSMKIPKDIASSLCCLNLSDNKIESLSIKSGIVTFPKIVDLDMSGNVLNSYEVVRDILSLKMHNLAMLDISDNPFLTNLGESKEQVKDLISKLEPFTDLTDLTLIKSDNEGKNSDSLGVSDDEEGESGLDDLDSLRQQDRIKVLNLSKSYRSVILQALPNLKYLDGLHRTTIGDGSYDDDQRHEDTKESQMNESDSLLSSSMKKRIELHKKRLEDQESEKNSQDDAEVDEFVERIKQQRQQAGSFLFQVRSELTSRIDAVRKHTERTVEGNPTPSNEELLSSSNGANRELPGKATKQTNSDDEYITTEESISLPASDKESTSIRLPSLISMFSSDLGLEASEAINTELALRESALSGVAMSIGEDSMLTIIPESLRQRFEECRRRAFSLVEEGMSSLNNAIEEPAMKEEVYQTSGTLKNEGINNVGMNLVGITREIGCESTLAMQKKDDLTEPEYLSSTEETTRKEEMCVPVASEGLNDEEDPIIRDDDETDEEADAMEDEEDVEDIVNGLLTASAALFTAKDKVSGVKSKTIITSGSQEVPIKEKYSCQQDETVKTAVKLLRPISAKRPSSARSASKILNSLFEGQAEASHADEEAHKPNGKFDVVPKAEEKCNDVAEPHSSSRRSSSSEVSKSGGLIVEMPNSRPFISRPSTPRPSTPLQQANPSSELEESRDNQVEKEDEFDLVVKHVQPPLTFRIPESLLRSADIAGPGRLLTANRPQGLNAVQAPLVAPGPDDEVVLSRDRSSRPSSGLRVQALTNRKVLNKRLV